MEFQKTALITGASKGLGLALAGDLAKKKWNILFNARHKETLFLVEKYLSGLTSVKAVAGDLRDEAHLLKLAGTLEANNWQLDLLVNNASALGISPLQKLLDHPVEDLHKVFHTNMIAPLSLLQKIRPYLNVHAKIINISSDAGVEAYETWGAYGGSKAGLDHMTAVLAKENPEYSFYSFDPGDMRTDMHQAAFPGEDISDRPLPLEFAVPAISRLIENDFPAGRYTIDMLKEEIKS